MRGRARARARARAGGRARGRGSLVGDGILAQQCDVLDYSPPTTQYSLTHYAPSSAMCSWFHVLPSARVVRLATPLIW